MKKSIFATILASVILSACGGGGGADQATPSQVSVASDKKFVASFNGRTMIDNHPSDDTGYDTVALIASNVVPGEEEYKQMLSVNGFNVTVWEQGKTGTENYFTVHLKNVGMHIKRLDTVFPSL